MHLSTVKVPIDLGFDWPWSSVLFLISNPCLSTKLCVSFICVGLYIFSETIASECSTFHRAPHTCGIMKKINFWLWAGWVASYLQRSLSAQVNGGPDATPDLWKQPFSMVRASGGYPGNALEEDLLGWGLWLDWGSSIFIILCCILI